MKPNTVVGALVLAVVVWGLPRSASAQINICNSGDQSLSVAVVSEPGEGRFVWDAGGWYHVEPGGCSKVVRALNYRYFLAFMTRSVDGSLISIDWRPAKRDQTIKVLKRYFCVHPTDKFSRRGSLPFLAQCPNAYQRALFPVQISKPVCYPVNENCIASLKLYVKATNSARGQALTAGPPVDEAAEAERQAQTKRDLKVLGEIFGKAFENLTAGTPLDPAYKIQRRPGGNIRMNPATAPNERAYRACRKQWHWKSETREDRFCQCVAKDVRFDKFTEKQMQRIDEDLSRYSAYGSVREQKANENAYDICYARAGDR